MNTLQLGLIQGNLRCFGANCNMSRNTRFLCYFFLLKYSSVLYFTLFPSLLLLCKLDGARTHQKTGLAKDQEFDLNFKGILIIIFTVLSVYIVQVKFIAGKKTHETHPHYNLVSETSEKSNSWMALCTFYKFQS